MPKPKLRRRYTRPARQGDHQRVVPASNACGKVAYRSQSDARRYCARYFAIDKTRMRPYFCDPDTGGCGLYHLGHLPDMVVKGVVTADEWYGRGGSPAYGPVLFGCLDLMREVGIKAPAFHRGADQSWTVGATIRRQRYHQTGHPDPVAATEATIALYRALTSADTGLRACA